MTATLQKNVPRRADEGRVIWGVFVQATPLCGSPSCHTRTSKYSSLPRVPFQDQFSSVGSVRPAPSSGATRVGGSYATCVGVGVGGTGVFVNVGRGDGDGGDCNTGVGVGVVVPVGLGVAVAVSASVAVGVAVGAAVDAGVAVLLGVPVAAGAAVLVDILVAVRVGLRVDVGDGEFASTTAGAVVETEAVVVGWAGVDVSVASGADPATCVSVVYSGISGIDREAIRKPIATLATTPSTARIPAATSLRIGIGRTSPYIRRVLITNIGRYGYVCIL